MEWVKITDEGEIEFVSAEVKLVPEVQAILTMAYNKGQGDFEGRKKLRAKTEMKYLYLAYSKRSPYKDFSEDERIIEARDDCKFPPDWKPSKELIALIPKFQNGTQNKVARLLGTVTKFIDKFEKNLNNIDLNERTASGGLLYKSTDIMATLERLPRLAETLQELENQANTGVIVKTASKGDHELGWMANKPAKTVRDREEEDEEDN